MNRRKTFGTVAALVVFMATVTGALAADPNPDWKTLDEEAIAVLSRYIQIDTTNPPGNEIKAAEFFKQIFDRAGIEAHIIEAAPGRGNIFARLRGDGTKKAVVLLNHMDVVPADPKFWKEAPFGGVIKDGVVWGRGALDAKGRAVLELMTLLTLKRQNVRLKGDVIFLGTADEEAGGAFGVGYLVEKHFESFENVGLVLNEGGSIRLGPDGKARFYTVGVAEKTPLWLRLTARGTPGHGSTPRSNMAVHKLVAALHRVLQYQTPLKVVPQVQKYYVDIAHRESEENRGRYQDIAKALQDPAFAAEFTRSAQNNANVRNTISVTGIKGSDKVNVIPAEASAQLDVRLLPGEDPQAFINELKIIMADDSIKIDVILSFPPAISPPHPEAMEIIAEMAKNDGGAQVVSPLGRGFTDCHFFREKGIPCLGFMPLRSMPAEEGLTHGIDERITIESLRAGLRAMYEIVYKLTAE
jgi:acetylornithine deacetylase/succinyl-diaminopimelate desuccinylase-like protein